ncbi:hypothetical protein EJ08DRAFT_550712, partial [Tothia fuscella]
SDEDIYTIPLKEPSHYGAGIRKRGIKFIPASDPNAELTPAPIPKSFAERYLSIVIGESSQNAEDVAQNIIMTSTETTTCEICKLPLDPKNIAAHESSLAHQSSLQHIHPPSAVDRKRKGVSYLQSYGWDPDSRLGLGAEGEGIRHPIQAQEKVDKAGVGVDRSRSITPGKAVPVEVQKALSAKELRKQERDKKRRDERLHDMFYTDDRVAKYL